MRRWALMALLALLGCGGSEDEEPATPAPVTCARPSGLYRVVSSPEAEECTGQSDNIVDLSKGSLPGEVPSGCQGEATISPDRCKYTAVYQCAVGKNTVSVTWDPDTMNGSGIHDLGCRRTFTTTFTKL